MKKYQLHTKTEEILKRFPALCKRLEGAARTPEIAGAPRVLCLDADLEKAGACVAAQCGLAEPVSLGTVSRESVLSLLPALRARGWRCVVGMEACGFGWRFQRQLREAGAEVLTFATEALSGRRKTNIRDAAALRPAGGRAHRAWQPQGRPPGPRALARGATAPLSEPAPGATHRPARQNRGARPRVAP